MARDIDEFLRRAAERRKQQKQKQGGQKPPARQTLSQQRQAPKPRQQKSKLLIDDNEVRVIHPKTDMRHETLEQHVDRHMDTHDVTDHASHLAEDLEQADERMEARLHKKFDHDVGSMGGDVNRDAATVDQGPISQVASDMIKLINDPKTLRQAIIMSEILNRPNFFEDE